MGAFALVWLLWAQPAAAWVHIATATGGGPTNPATASTNFSGCDFVVVIASIYNAIYTPPLVSGDMTDGGNTYTLLTVQTAGNSTTGIWYAKNATCGASHVVTLNRASIYAGVVASAWSGSDTTAPFRDENGAANNGSISSLATGNAGANTDLLIAGLEVSTTEADSATEANGFTLRGRIAYAAANNAAAQLWSLVASGANQASFSFSASANSNVAVIASFKAGGGGGGSPVPKCSGGLLLRGVGCQGQP